MALSTLLLTCVLPLLVSSQNFPTNVTTIGQGVPSDDYALTYYEALPQARTVNSVQFQGFNWTIPITNRSYDGETTNSTENWSLLIAYGQVDVPYPLNSESSRNVSTGNTVFSLGFPESPWPLNGTDWQLCAAVLNGAFPAAVSNKNGKNSGDCEQYLGASCVTAWSYAYRNVFASNQGDGCPAPPLLSDIKECVSLFNGVADPGMRFGVISNTTYPTELYYSANNTYLNASSDQVLDASSVPRQGLSWGQWFASIRTVFPESSNATVASADEARQLRMVGMSLVPSEAFRAEYSLFGYQPNVRMICGRADYTSSASSIIRAIPSGTVLVALFATLVALW